MHYRHEIYDMVRDLFGSDEYSRDVSERRYG